MDDFCQAHQIRYTDECPKCAQMVVDRLANESWKASEWHTGDAPQMYVEGFRMATATTELKKAYYESRLAQMNKQLEEIREDREDVKEAAADYHERLIEISKLLGSTQQRLMEAQLKMSEFKVLNDTSDRVLPPHIQRVAKKIYMRITSFQPLEKLGNVDRAWIERIIGEDVGGYMQLAAAWEKNYNALKSERDPYRAMLEEIDRVLDSADMQAGSPAHEQIKNLLKKY